MATNISQDDFHKTGLRLPRDLHARLHEAAAESGRSYNAEIVARLQSSFQPQTSDADLMEMKHFLESKDTERELLRETGRHLQKIITSQETEILLLRAYLTEIINSLPKKFQSDGRVRVAARFAMGYDDGGDEFHALQLPLAIGRVSPSEAVHATVRGKDVDTGVPLTAFLKPNEKRKKEPGSRVTPANKVILVPSLGCEPLPAAEKTPPNTGPTRSPNARKLTPKKIGQ